jgi:hypothetical protein
MPVVARRAAGPAAPGSRSRSFLSLPRRSCPASQLPRGLGSQPISIMGKTTPHAARSRVAHVPAGTEALHARKSRLSLRKRALS